MHVSSSRHLYGLEETSRKRHKDMNTNLIQNSNQSLTINDLQVIEDEPRIKDIVLGERLGFNRAVKIKDIIKRNIQELQGFGAFPQIGETMKVGCVNRKIMTYYLNEAQALLLCMFSRTAKAAQVRKELIDVYMTYRTRGLAKVREHYRQITTAKKPRAKLNAVDIAKAVVAELKQHPICENQEFSVEGRYRYSFRPTNNLLGAGVYRTKNGDTLQAIQQVASDDVIYRQFNLNTDKAEGRSFSIPREELEKIIAAKMTAKTELYPLDVRSLDSARIAH